MKKTFTTVMPDRIGAFLDADRALTALGLNITRVSYNKAVDKHTLFIEVEGDEEQLLKADKELTALGYLNRPAWRGDVILMEFRLPDRPGAVMPVLELIHEYHFNISYISSQADGSGYQSFKMGLYVNDGNDITEFAHRAAMLCPLKVLDYNKSEKVLDNTVFYLSFANEISEKMSLSEEEKGLLLVDSNLIMQMLDEKNLPPYKTFDYIGRFADLLLRYKGERFQPRLSRGKTAMGIDYLLCEPPCGSNIAVFFLSDRLVFLDSGFPCYRRELWSLLEREIPDFKERRKELILSHADVDHAGLADLFDKVYVNRKCYDNFAAENRGRAALREENPVHAPYIRISKILSGYRPPRLEMMEIIGERDHGNDAPLAFIGTVDIGPWSFEVYEGCGGHVRGEMIWLEPGEKMAFTGDIFVNIKGFTAEQAEFNRLAPYLMTSVDTDPEAARRERKAFLKLLDPGDWRIFGGHGAVTEICIGERE